MFENELGFSAFAEVLKSADGRDFIDAFAPLAEEGAPRGIQPAERPVILEHALRLGLVDERLALTRRGRKFGDSVREFEHWTRRGRTVHGWGSHPWLTAEFVAGKRVLEVGCGSGVNVIALAAHCREVVGLDIERSYLRCGRLWAELVGAPAPHLVNSPSEDMPFADGEFDLVLCFGALQYTDIAATLKESGRVLRSGGAALFILSDLRDALWRYGAKLPSSIGQPRRLVAESLDLFSNVVYPWAGRVASKANSPIYPPRSVMRGYIDAAGLALDPELTRRQSGELWYAATKR